MPFFYHFIIFQEETEKALAKALQDRLADKEEIQLKEGESII